MNPIKRAPSSITVVFLFLPFGQAESREFTPRWIDLEEQSVCVGEFELSLAESLQGLFDKAPNSMESIRFPRGQPFSLDVELLSDASPDALLAVAENSNSFWIQLSAEGGRVVGVDRTAVLFALDWLARVVKTNDCRVSLGEVLDWAELKVRALHFILKRISLKTGMLLIDKARLARFNTIIVGVADAVDIRPDIVPPRSDALTKDDFQSLVAYARANGMEVIPGLPLLTGMQGFFKSRHPHLMYNATTYDPRQPEVYELVFAYLDSLMETMNPRAIHIGHDELKGLTGASRRKWLNPGEQALPPELFLQDVIKLNDFLLSRQIEVWMWGDMLIAHSEFPEMHRKNFHGTHGFNKLRDKIPKNIVIADWHYHHETSDFPSAKAFADAGHDVVGVSWKNMNNIRLFSEYMPRLGKRGRGMIAGTFFHVQKGEWDIVDAIIAESGYRFWAAGPDQERAAITN
jgi:hypothetical protein